MVQLKILSGKLAGFLTETRQFPFRVGRGAGNDWRLEAEGVWAEHFEITSNPDSGFHLATLPGAKLMVNQAPVETARLRNGDLLTVGALNIAFGISPTQQRGLRIREAFVWTLIFGITLGQLALIAWLLRNP